MQFTGFEQLTNANRTGKIWLNSVPVVMELLENLQRCSWHHWSQHAADDISSEEATRRESEDVDRFEAIFAGKDDRYSALEWNTDPRQLRQHIISSFYLKDCATAPEFAPATEDAIRGILDSVSAGPRCAIGYLTSGEIEYCEKSLRRIFLEFFEDAIHHTGFLLGIPKHLVLKFILDAAQVKSRNSPSGK